jgi:hypothetical protein
MFGADMVGVEKRVVLESEIGRWIAARRSALCLICSVKAGGRFAYSMLQGEALCQLLNETKLSNR